MVPYAAQILRLFLSLRFPYEGVAHDSSVAMQKLSTSNKAKVKMLFQCFFRSILPFSCVLLSVIAEQDDHYLTFSYALSPDLMAL